MQFAGERFQSPGQGFGRTMRSTSSRNGEPFELGEVAHLQPITTCSEDDASQLQQDLRLVHGKVVTADWYMSETVGNRLKLLQLYQTGASYLHYSNVCRKELREQIVHENEKTESEVTPQATQIARLKKTIDKERDNLYNLKDQHKIKKEAVKEYREYLDKLHYCQKCKRYVRKVRDHQKKYHSEPVKEQQPSASPATQELITTLLKENRDLMLRMQQRDKERTLGAEEMHKILDELKTIKLGMQHKASTEQKPETGVNTESESASPGPKISKPPSINSHTAALNQKQVARQVQSRQNSIISKSKGPSIPSSPTNIVNPLMGLDDLPDRSIDSKQRKRNSGMKMAASNSEGEKKKAPTVDDSRAQEMDNILDKSSSKHDEDQDKYRDDDFQIDDDKPTVEKPLTRSDIPDPFMRDLDMESRVQIKPSNVVVRQQSNIINPMGLPSSIGENSRIVVRKPNEPLTPSTPPGLFQDLKENSRPPVRHAQDLSRYGDSSNIAQLTSGSSSGPSSGVPTSNVRNHNDADQGNLMVTQDINFSIIPEENNSSSQVESGLRPEIRRVESPRNTEHPLGESVNSIPRDMLNTNLLNTNLLLESRRIDAPVNPPAEMNRSGNMPEADLNNSRNLDEPEPVNLYRSQSSIGNSIKLPQQSMIGSEVSSNTGSSIGRSLMGRNLESIQQAEEERTNIPQADLNTTSNNLHQSALNMPETDLNNTRDLNQPPKAPARNFANAIKRPLEIDLSAIAQNDEEANQSSLIRRNNSNNKRQQSKDPNEIPEEMANQSLLRLTPNEEASKKQVRSLYDKIVAMRDQKLREADMQSEVDHHLSTARECVEREFEEMFGKPHSSLSSENPMVIGSYIRRLNESIASAKPALDSQKKRTTQRIKQNQIQPEHSLEMSQSGSIFKQLGSKAKQPSRVEPSLNFDLKEESIVQPRRKVQSPSEFPDMPTDSIVRKPQSSIMKPQPSRQSQMAKEIKNFDLDDPLASVKEQHLKQQLSKAQSGDSFSDD